MAKIGRVIRHTKVVRDFDTHEWIVKCWDQDMERYEECDYFADDKEDALATQECMMIAWDIWEEENCK